MQTQHIRRVDNVRRSLEEAILSGQLRPGDRLPVIPLARQFGISQSTIREALLMLERRGLVKSRPRHGAYVTRLSEREAVELCRARALIEAYAVTVGVTSLSDAVLETLHGYVDAMQRCLLPGDLPLLIQIDLTFHQTIAALGDSETLLEIWSNLNGRIGALIIRSLEANQLHIEDVVSYHTEVIDALATHKPGIARIAIIRHYVSEQDEEVSQTDSMVSVVHSLVGAPA